MATSRSFWLWLWLVGSALGGAAYGNVPERPPAGLEEPSPAPRRSAGVYAGAVFVFVSVVGIALMLRKPPGDEPVFKERN